MCIFNDCQAIVIKENFNISSFCYKTSIKIALKNSKMEMALVHLPDCNACAFSTCFVKYSLNTIEVKCVIRYHCNKFPN